MATGIDTAAKWKSSTFSLSAVQHRIIVIMIYEQIEATRRDSRDFFHSIWQPWLSYIAHPRFIAPLICLLDNLLIAPSYVIFSMNISNVSPGYLKLTL